MQENDSICGGVLLLDNISHSNSLAIDIKLEGAGFLEELYLSKRYEVFVKELGYYKENESGLEKDDQDKFSLHVVSMQDGVVKGYCRLLPFELSQFKCCYSKYGIRESSLGTVEITRFMIPSKYRKTRQIVPLGIGAYIGASVLKRELLVASTPVIYESIYSASGAQYFGETIIDSNHGLRKLFYLDRFCLDEIVGTKEVVEKLICGDSCSINASIKSILFYQRHKKRITSCA